MKLSIFYKGEETIKSFPLLKFNTKIFTYQINFIPLLPILILTAFSDEEYKIAMKDLGEE